MQPLRRLDRGVAVHDRPVRRTIAVDRGAVGILLGGAVEGEPLLAARALQFHADILQIDADGALGALDQHIVLGPAEGRAVLERGEPLVAEFERDEQQIVLVAV